MTCWRSSCVENVAFQSFASECKKNFSLITTLVGRADVITGRTGSNTLYCAQTIASRPVTSRDLLMAYRWPAAVVLSSLVLAVTAAKLLSRPIPIAIEGGLQVDKLVLPPSVTIRSVTPLPVVVQEQVTIGGDAPLAIEGPVSVKSIAGAVTVNADARVSGVEGQVSVTADDPLAVRADVSVDDKITIGGKVDTEGKVKPTLLPVPGL